MPAIVLLLAAVAAGAQQREALLEAFDYPTLEAAREAWRPSNESPPVTLTERDGGQALRLAADFTTGEAPRVYHDRTVALDLTLWGRFTLDLKVETPGLFGRLTLFFQSGPGWYGASIPLDHLGWQTISIPRSAFGIEGEPLGWDQITGIRLSPWRGAARAGAIEIDNLRGYREDIVVVIGTNAMRDGGAEMDAVQGYAEQMSHLLDGAGVMTGTVTDEEVERGALAGRKLAIFAYSPNLSEAEVAAVRGFVAEGGKVLAFYSLGGGLAELFGVSQVTHRRAEADEFHRVEIEAGVIEGTPEGFIQDSWNIQAATVDPARGRVIGWWRAPDGTRDEAPALVMSDAGIWLAHVLTGGDEAAKRRFMLAVVGHYVPEVWRQVADTVMAPPERLGHLAGLDAIRNWFVAHPPAAARWEQHNEHLRRSTAAYGDGRYIEAMEEGTAADAILHEVYIASMAPRPGEFRALWNHSGTGAHGDWAVSMQNLADCGFNAIIPNLLWGGVALYDSEVLPHHPVVAARGDQIAACVEAARPHGIAVHVWKVNYNLGGDCPPAFRDELAAAGRLQVDRAGNTMPWLCPSHPENQRLELESMVEVARDYDVAGVHFDYIRYPGGQTCFCAGCRERFQAASGLTIADWPAGLDAPAVRPVWSQWRQDNISALVEAVAGAVRAIKPTCQISAAVFRDFPHCKETVAQDWVMWIERGWLDFVCPMDYTNSDSEFAANVESQLEYVAGRVPVYPGIGVTASNSTLPPHRVAGQIHLARELGAGGFVLFNYGGAVPSELLPLLALGPTRP